MSDQFSTATPMKFVIWGIIALIALGFLTMGREAGALVFGGGLFTLVLLPVYFLPALIAEQRGHNNVLAIFMLTLFLGWTFLGWVIAMVWACTSNVKQKVIA